jgi:protoporphyrinogen IX oxidase
MTQFLTFKALHIIFVVTWFSALFFLGRILIYHSESLDKKESEKSVLIPLFLKAERNIIWIILIPSITLAIIFGLYMMLLTRAYEHGWFHIKMALLIIFLIYNGYLLRLRRQIRLEHTHPKGFKLRLLNEVPFIFLVGIVFTVYHKNFFSGLWAVLVLLAVITTIAIFFRIKKNYNASPEGLIKRTP